MLFLNPLLLFCCCLLAVVVCCLFAADFQYARLTSYNALYFNGTYWNDPVFLNVCDDVCAAGQENAGCTFVRLSGPESADFNGHYRLFFARHFQRSCASLFSRPSDTFWSDFKRDVGVTCVDSANYSMSYGGVLTCTNCASCFDGNPSDFEVGASLVSTEMSLSLLGWLVAHNACLHDSIGGHRLWWRLSERLCDVRPVPQQRSCVRRVSSPTLWCCAAELRLITARSCVLITARSCVQSESAVCQRYNDERNYERRARRERYVGYRRRPGRHVHARS